MYIEKINSPQDVKALNTEEMKQLAQEMRTVLIKKLSITADTSALTSVWQRLL